MGEITVGSLVMIPAKGIAGICQFVGSTGLGGAQWVGLELPEPTGENDGEFEGKRYFSCPHKHGTFVPLSQVQLLKPAEKVIVPLKQGARSDIGPEKHQNNLEDEDDEWDLDVDAARNGLPDIAPLTVKDIKASPSAENGSVDRPQRPGQRPAKISPSKPARPNAAPDRSKELVTSPRRKGRGTSPAKPSSEIVIEPTAAPREVHSENGGGPLKPGDKLTGDDLELVLKRGIGEGSFAKVFEAVETGTGLVVAAKIFIEGDDNTTTHSARMALAEHEYNVVGFLNHDNIVRVHGLLLTNGTVCILQELLPNGDLFNAVQAGYGVEAELAVNCITGLFSALRYLHDPCTGLVHLDIKPENILLSATNEPKLCDFDTAMKIDSSPTQMRGTPEYQAPESMPTSSEYWYLRASTENGGFPIHPALDVWAAGLVAYFIMFGDYCWGKADRHDDDQYYRFNEGEHMEISPWTEMPSAMIAFFNRTLDARQQFRASASEIVDMVSPDVWVAMLEKLRDSKVQSNPEYTQALLVDRALLSQLNQTDNWNINVTAKIHGKVTMYGIALTPPREIDKSGRIEVEVRYRRLLQLHNIVTQRYPPLASANPYAIRQVAVFPRKKRFGNKTSKFVDQRRTDLLDYFRVSFLASELAVFWYEALRELQDMKNSGSDEDNDED